MSARLPQFSKLTKSKTKQFCETSFKNGKLSAELTASCQCVLRFCDSTCLNYCACHEKVIPGHTKCCTCHAKSSQQTWRSDAPKCKPFSGNQRPDLLTTLMNMSLVLRLPRKMHLCRSSSNVPRLPSCLEMRQNPHVWAQTLYSHHLLWFRCFTTCNGRLHVVRMNANCLGIWGHRSELTTGSAPRWGWWTWRLPPFQSMVQLRTSAKSPIGTMGWTRLLGDIIAPPGLIFSLVVSPSASATSTMA